MLEEIISIAKESFSDEDLKATSKLEDANGFDSMALIQFIIELEANFDMKINEEKIAHNLTFIELEEILKERN